MLIDGAIKWGPDGPRPITTGFGAEARKKAVYEWVRQIRGGVLGGVFTIETHLNATIQLFILGKRADIPEVFEIFDDNLLSWLTFDRRISIAKDIAARLFPSEKAVAFRSDLSTIRTIRNAMAHHSFWFEPQLNEKGELFELVPVIKVGKGSEPLTSSYIERLNLQISSLIEKSIELESLVREYEAARIH